MSAIFGIIDLEGRPIEKEWINSMQADLAHRGPEGQRIYESTEMFFGHMLLQITPESVYDTSPYEEHGFVITAHARLDERKAIMDRLQIPQAEREIITDPLLLLRSFRKFGENFVKDIYGDFAFAIWDKEKKELFCARDQMGVKPFYYYFQDKRFIFSTEIKSIVKLNIVETTIDNIHLRDQAIGLFHTVENTTWEHIALLKQSCTLTLKKETLLINKYWFPKYKRNNKYKTEKDSSTELLRLLKQSISDQTRTIGNIGADLSGGLDSSTIVSLASKHLLKQNRTITTVSSVYEPSYSNPENPDEKEYIDEVIKNTSNISPHFVNRTNFNFWKGLKKEYEKTFTPVFSFYYVQNAIFNEYNKKGIRRVLNGNPGDYTASNSGINPFTILLCSGNFKRLVTLSRQTLDQNNQSLTHFIKHNILRELIPWNLQKMYFKFRGTNFHDFADISFFPYNFDANEKNKIEKELFKANSLSSLIEEHISKHIWPQTIDLISEEADCRASRHNVEMTFPFADRRLIEFLLQIPVEHFYAEGVNRGLIRKALKGILPDKIVNRKNKGEFSPGHIEIFKKEIPEICSYLEGTKFNFNIKNCINVKILCTLIAEIKLLNENDILTSKEWSLTALAQLFLFNQHIIEELYEKNRKKNME